MNGYVFETGSGTPVFRSSLTGGNDERHIDCQPGRTHYRTTGFEKIATGIPDHYHNGILPFNSK